MQILVKGAISAFLPTKKIEKQNDEMHCRDIMSFLKMGKAHNVNQRLNDSSEMLLKKKYIWSAVYI